MKYCTIVRTAVGRQMSLAFDAAGSVGLEPADRKKAVTALALILMQAAGIRLEEATDDRH